MVPTRKLLFLAALGLIPAVLAAVFPGLVLVALLWLAACCGLMAGSYRWGARPEQVEVVRRVEPRLNLGQREAVELVVRNFTRYALRMQVTDTPPAGWEVEGLPFQLNLKPCLLYTSPSPRDLSTSRMPSSA